MKNEKYFNGFILGMFVGGILGIIVVRLVDNGIL
jgi:glycerol uptake facilitator-like aquaporin